MCQAFTHYWPKVELAACMNGPHTPDVMSVAGVTAIEKSKWVQDYEQNIFRDRGLILPLGGIINAFWSTFYKCDVENTS